MQYKRVLVIGDIHGNFPRLLSVYQKIHFQPAEDLLIFLGDYIDRGRENLASLRWVMQRCQQPGVIALRGNHEQLLWDYYMQGGDDGMWRANGGEATYQELAAAVDEDPAAIDRCLAFIDARPCSFALTVGEKKFFFCHAGVDPEQPLEEQRPEDLLWIRDRFYRGYQGKTLVVVGHTNTERFQPGCNTPIWRKNNILLMDTGSYLPAGRISCVDVLTGTCWQSDAPVSR